MIDDNDPSVYRNYHGVSRTLQGATPALQARDLIAQLRTGATQEPRVDGATNNGFLSDPAVIRSVSLEGSTLVLDFTQAVVTAGDLNGDSGGTDVVGVLMANAFVVPAVQSFELRGNGSCQTFARWIDAGLSEQDSPACVTRTRLEAQEWQRTTGAEPIAPEPAPSGEFGPPEPVCGISQPDCVEPSVRAVRTAPPE